MANGTWAVDMWKVGMAGISPPYDTRAKELGFVFSDTHISTATDSYLLLGVTEVPDQIPEWIHKLEPRNTGETHK